MGDTMQTNTLTITDHGLVAGVDFKDPEDAIRIRALLESRGDSPTAVKLAPAPGADVEGHAELQSLALTLHLDEDDTEGHAISVHFPTAADASRFRRNLIATGVLTGSVILGTAGAIAITSQPAPAQTAPIQRTPVYERPAGHGALEGVDMINPANAAAPAIAITGVTPAFDTATGKPAGKGFLEDADGPAPVTTETTDRSPGHGPLEGVDR